MKNLFRVRLTYFLAVIGAVILPAGCMKPLPAFESTESFASLFHDRPKADGVFPGSGKLSLQKAIETALCNNPTNLAAAQSVSAARYGYFKALSAYAPEINASHLIGHTLSRGWDLKNPPVGVMKRNDHLTTNTAIQASWLLFDGFARELEAIIARQEYSKSRAIEKNVVRLLERAVAYAYYDMYLAGEEIIIFEEDLAFQNAALDQAEERFRNGHVSKASVLNFRILAARAGSNISNARYRRKVAFHALAALMGYDLRYLPERIELEKISREELFRIYDESYYLDLAVMLRPDLKGEKIALHIARRSKQKAIAGLFPVIRLFSESGLDSFDAQYGGYRVSGARSRQWSFTYGADVRWNLFQGFATVNAIRRQAALERAALWGLNAKFLEVAAEVRDAHANCQNTRYQIRIFQDMAQWVREQRDLVFSEYSNGRETITRLNEAQSTLVEAQSRLIVSQIEFSKAAAQLAAAAGVRVSQLLPESSESDKRP